MRPNPVWIRPDATVREAATFFADKRISAAPVINSEGRPVGVLSQSDLVLHSREMVEFLSGAPEYYSRTDLKALRDGVKVVDVERTPVRDIMTPVVFSVSPETPAPKVIEDMLTRQIHRLFVVGEDGVVVGIISTLDVLCHLQQEQGKNQF
jgi:CBS domain-containing protein